MNKWTKKSLDLANSRGYLDKLTEIYPVSVSIRREIPGEILEEIRKAHKDKNKKALFTKVLGLERFPFDDSYVASLRKHPELIEKNPKIVGRITERLLSLEVEDLIKLATTPKSSSRRYGDSFKSWLKGIGTPVLPEPEFERRNKSLLEGSDETLGKYVAGKFSIPEPEKGFDMVLKTKNKFFAGEAKFISDYGGSQGNQFNVAINVSKINKTNLNGVAIIDGIPWFTSKSKMHKAILDSDSLILSALLLKDFIEDLTS